MIRRVFIGMNGKAVIEFTPGTEQDLQELQRLYQVGALDARGSFADEMPKKRWMVPQWTVPLLSAPPLRCLFFLLFAVSF